MLLRCKKEIQEIISGRRTKRKSDDISHFSHAYMHQQQCKKKLITSYNEKNGSRGLAGPCLINEEIDRYVNKESQILDSIGVFGWYFQTYLILKAVDTAETEIYLPIKHIGL